MITKFYDFMDEWNAVIGCDTPRHHREIMRFLVDVWYGIPHRGLLPHVYYYIVLKQG